MPAIRLGNLQLRILQALWDGGGGTVADVQMRLAEEGADDEPAGSGLAYTTVATMLRKMEDRGLVRHEAQGRKFVYHAVAKQRDVTRSMTHDILDRLFEGSLADMVSHLLTSREVSRHELARLEQLIAERKQKKRGS